MLSLPPYHSHLPPFPYIVARPLRRKFHQSVATNPLSFGLLLLQLFFVVMLSLSGSSLSSNLRGYMMLVFTMAMFI